MAITAQRVWLAGFISLGAAEIGATTATRVGLLRGMRGLGLVGGAGLTWSAVRDLRAAKTVNERMDALGDLAWGAEGLTYFAAPSSATMGTIAQGLGIAGGICQTAVGCRRIYQGFKQRDRSKIVLGALDVAGGLFWLGWDLAGWENPLFLAGVAGSMLLREGYANRDALKKMGKRTLAGVKCGFNRCKQGVARGARWARQGVGSTLRRLSAGLRSRAPPWRSAQAPPARE